MSAGRKLGAEEARALVKGRKRLLVMKGPKVAVFDLATSPPKDAELLELLLGTTGNLRATVAVSGMVNQMPLMSSISRLPMRCSMVPTHRNSRDLETAWNTRVMSAAA